MNKLFYYLDFELFLLVATLLTAIIWLIYKFFAKKQQKEPWYVEVSKSFFPVLLIVLLVRSFLVEPFRIPSGSMQPSLLIGDFIVVNKFAYGMYFPVFHNKIVPGDLPVRGDVIVFRVPKNNALETLESGMTAFVKNPYPKVDYIKRVIGVPGDTIRYTDKKIYINQQEIPYSYQKVYIGKGANANMNGAKTYQENLLGKEHTILLDESREGIILDEITIPEGYYFVMGDNRDNSNDSRYWGFVPKENLVGKATYIWLNWDWQGSHMDFSRVGQKIN